eukprot:4227443-Karenia_brevis.AAC.1
MLPEWNDSVPKPLPPLDHARRQILPPPPAPPRPVLGDAAATETRNRSGQIVREVDRFNDEVRQEQIEAKASQIEATM